MLATFAEAARVLNGERVQVHCQVAERKAGFLWRELRQQNGRLWHTWNEGVAKINGRPRELQDNAVPSGNGMATVVLLRLAELAIEPRYVTLVERSQGQVGGLLARHALGFAQWLIGLDNALAPFRAVAIVGDPKASDTPALLKVCTTGYRPHQVVAVGFESSEVPLLQGRDQIEGQATAYVCTDWVCRFPVTDPVALKALLE